MGLLFQLHIIPLLQHKPEACTVKAANGDRVGEFHIESFRSWAHQLHVAGQLRCVHVSATCLSGVHYTGKLLADGSVFDSSLDRGQPIEFPLGQGQVSWGLLSWRTQ